jgi:hypothetical protein
VFENGKDVFGREPACRACHLLLGSFRAQLAPEVERLLESERARRARGDPASRRNDFGKLDAAISQAVPRACHTQAIFGQRDARRRCLRLVEDHEDDLIDLFGRWAAGGGGWENVRWNEEVCLKMARACPEALGLRPLEEFDDDGAGGGGDRTYRTEPPPRHGEDREGNVRKVVASNFYATVVQEEKRDHMVYFAFPSREPGFHRAAWPKFTDLADRLAAEDLLRDLELAKVDAEWNDVPPPYGDGIDGPTLVYYPAGAKSTPVYMTNPDPRGRIPLYDLLYFILTATRSKTLATFAARAVQQAGSDALYHVVETEL